MPGEFPSTFRFSHQGCRDGFEPHRPCVRGNNMIPAVSTGAEQTTVVICCGPMWITILFAPTLAPGRGVKCDRAPFRPNAPNQIPRPAEHTGRSRLARRFIAKTTRTLRILRMRCGMKNPKVGRWIRFGDRSGGPQREDGGMGASDGASAAANRVNPVSVAAPRAARPGSGGPEHAVHDVRESRSKPRSHQLRNNAHCYNPEASKRCARGKAASSDCVEGRDSALTDCRRCLST